MKRNRDVVDSNELTEPKRPKTDNIELLNAIFRFKHKPPSVRQDNLLCETLAKEFTVFVATLKAVVEPNLGCGRVNPLVHDRVIPAGVFNIHEVDVLKNVCGRLKIQGDNIHQRGDIWYDPWLPAYGCALQRTQISAAVIKLHVIFVDGWERVLHFVPTGTCVHSAVSTMYHESYCADLDSALEEKFGQMFTSKLEKAQMNRGSKRNAAFNSLGHQKTPHFIVAVVRRAVAAVMRRTLATSSSSSSDEDEEEDDHKELFANPFDDGEDFIENIKLLVTAYKKNVCEWRQLPQLTSVLDVEHCSREMLVMWIAFCLVHQKCVDEVPLCAEYNIALDWQDLKVAVLSDRVTITALQHVSKYIRRWNEKTQGLQLFHLANQTPTFGFGQKFALNCSSMMDIYTRDVESWERYVQRKWEEIERKKSRAAEIRAQLFSLREKLQWKQRELSNRQMK